MSLLVHKETAILNARVDALSEAMYVYKAIERDGVEKEAKKKEVERQIASIYYCLQELSNQFSVISINDYLCKMNEEDKKNVRN